MIGKPGFLGKNFKNTFFFAIQSKIIAQSVDGDVMRTDSFEKTLMLGKIEGGRRREQQRMR